MNSGILNVLPFLHSMTTVLVSVSLSRFFLTCFTHINLHKRNLTNKHAAEDLSDCCIAGVKSRKHNSCLRILNKWRIMSWKQFLNYTKWINTSNQNCFTSKAFRNRQTAISDQLHNYICFQKIFMWLVEFFFFKDLRRT